MPLSDIQTVGAVPSYQWVQGQIDRGVSPEVNEWSHTSTPPCVFVGVHGDSFTSTVMFGCDSNPHSQMF
jgi:hypothetical protein